MTDSNIDPSAWCTHLNGIVRKAGQSLSDATIDRSAYATTPLNKCKKHWVVATDERQWIAGKALKRLSRNTPVVVLNTVMHYFFFGYLTDSSVCRSEMPFFPTIRTISHLLPCLFTTQLFRTFIGKGSNPCLVSTCSRQTQLKRWKFGVGP